MDNARGTHTSFKNNYFKPSAHLWTSADNDVEWNGKPVQPERPSANSSSIQDVGIQGPRNAIHRNNQLERGTNQVLQQTSSARKDFQAAREHNQPSQAGLKSIQGGQAGRNSRHPNEEHSRQFFPRVIPQNDPSAVKHIANNEQKTELSVQKRLLRQKPEHPLPVTASTICSKYVNKLTRLRVSSCGHMRKYQSIGSVHNLETWTTSVQLQTLSYISTQLFLL